jgi:hypothetical protein
MAGVEIPVHEQITVGDRSLHTTGRASLCFLSASDKAPLCSTYPCNSVQTRTQVTYEFIAKNASVKLTCREMAGQRL